MLPDARVMKKNFAAASLAIVLAAGWAALPAFATEASSEADASEEELIDSNSLLGSYLAGRIARYMRDADNAVVYYQRALEKDPDNKAIVDDAFQLELATGNFDNAKELAQQIIKRDRGHRIARIFLGLDAFKRKDYAKADAHFAIADKGSPGEPTVTLARAWVALAQNKPQRAFALLKTLNQVEWAQHFATVHRAFIADLANHKKTAAAAYADLYEKTGVNARVAEAYARHTGFRGDVQRAITILKEKSAHTSAMGKALLAELEGGKKPELLARNADEGMAEVFLGIGQVLVGNNGLDAAQIYLQLALFLNPDSHIAQVELAEILGSTENYEEAIQALDRIPDTSPLWLTAQIRKSAHLNALKREDEAVALLKRLMETHPEEVQIPQAIASIEAGRKNYAEAIPYYTKAIELIGKPEKRHWGLFYSRGVAYERTKQWAKAEPDFRKSLELDPEQAVTLNYLGYSWLDQGVNVQEAMELIRKAVKLRPNDGYIIDSLGWGYYLLKDYNTALKHLERAVELRPEDPTLNDHLGDVYWQVGRKLEAQFQWSQALTLDPEPEHAEKIKRKLATGIVEESGNVQAEAQKDAAKPAGH